MTLPVSIPSFAAGECLSTWEITAKLSRFLRARTWSILILTPTYPKLFVWIATRTFALSLQPAQRLLRFLDGTTRQHYDHQGGPEYRSSHFPIVRRREFRVESNSRALKRCGAGDPYWTPSRLGLYDPS